MFVLFIIFFIFSCHDKDPISDYNRFDFENKWWQLEQYPMCIMMNESGDFLTYEDHIIDQGDWYFQEPNLYIIDDREFFVFENDECWDIEYSVFNDTVCECILR